MRTIRFRAKRKDNGEWVSNGTLLQFNGESGVDYYMPRRDADCHAWTDRAGVITELDCDLYPVQQSTIGQALGMEDATGHDIFENDIVEYDGSLYRVRYLRKHGKYVGWNNEAKYKTINFSASTVVGNIYDDPDMLEGES